MKTTTKNDALLLRINYRAPVILCVILIAVLMLLPSEFENIKVYGESDLRPARVIDVDDSSIVDTGLIRSGEQRCTVEILSGYFSGHIAEANNLLNGSMEQDKVFAEGDTALVRINFSEDKIRSISMIDHYRIHWEILLAALFFVLLIIFAGRTGVRAILSFALTVLMIWKVLVHSYLKGINPIVVGLGICVILTFMIIGLVYGFDRRCLSAAGGSLLGILVSLVFGIIFTNLFKIHGAVMSSSESLLYAGYTHLNLTQIFMAAIFIGSSGAMMDLSVDITSAIDEVVRNRPDISIRDAIRSGMNVGRAAMGTMTTTLLLAYSGGFIALLMVFTAQGTPIEVLLNYKYVSAELLHTLIGSFGLVTVAPFTAISGGILLTRRVERTMPSNGFLSDKNDIQRLH